MNKAEEQYLYWWGKRQAQSNIMAFAHDNSWKKDFYIAVTLHLEEAAKKVLKVPQDDFARGIRECNGELLLLFMTNVITDWPSFVTYMTGETYEEEVKDGI